MKLLFDENLSRRLVTRLADIFPDSSDVTAVNLERATGGDVWEYAGRNGYALVSKDSEFNRRLGVLTQRLPAPAC